MTIAAHPRSVPIRVHRIRRPLSSGLVSLQGDRTSDGVVGVRSLVAESLGRLRLNSGLRLIHGALAGVRRGAEVVAGQEGVQRRNFGHGSASTINM